MRKSIPNYHINVFLNCPFDNEFLPLFRALTFTVQYCGFIPRCALETGGSEHIRIVKIIEIIRQCALGIHDLSRTELNQNQMPRFNMPLELGIFIGAGYLGKGVQTQKNYLILDSGQFRFKEYISDVSGQDIGAHSGTEEGIIKATRDWLSHHTNGRLLEGTQYIFDHYSTFKDLLPDFCKKYKLTPKELQFNEFTSLSSIYINATK